MPVLPASVVLELPPRSRCHSRYPTPAAATPPAAHNAPGGSSPRFLPRFLPLVLSWPASGDSLTAIAYRLRALALPVLRALPRLVFDRLAADCAPRSAADSAPCLAATLANALAAACAIMYRSPYP